MIDPVQQVLLAKPFATWAKKAAKSAHPFIAPIAHEGWAFATALALRVRPGPGTRTWIICPDARTQEQIHAELSIWGIQALFLPRLPHDPSDKETLTDPDLIAERLTVFTKLSTPGNDSSAQVIVISADSLTENVPTLTDLSSHQTLLTTGESLDTEALLTQLNSAGYERVPVVAERGQFARRGDIIDIFPWQAEEPLRLEIFGDDIESIRTFDIHTQTSIRRHQSHSLLLTVPETTTVPLSDLLHSNDHQIHLEDLSQFPLPHSAFRISISSTPQGTSAKEDHTLAIYESPLGTFNAGDFVLQQNRRDSFIQQITDWHRDGWQISIYFHNEAERERFEELIGTPWLNQQNVHRPLALLHRGFTVPGAKLAILAGAEIFGRHQHHRRLKGSKLDEALVLRQARDHLRELKPGDLVVHTDYGIGKYDGIEIRPGPPPEEVIIIRYADQAKLFVPPTQAHLISRYVGVGSHAPKLNKLGDARWNKTRAQAERSVEEFAARMLSIAAERQTLKGYAHTPDTKWQVEFEQSFVYRETPDQIRAVEEIKRDMELEKPMDRLLCGDVGFGKTEVAIRAAFKAVMSGKQVAVLVPTTVLAQQHWQTFRERMSDYPVRVEMLSRLTPPKKVRETIAALKAGNVDIVIGTHRVISKDVQFKNLGLAIVDEEQRFGVKHKEKFKELFRLIDVLTLSATPIPRTLYLALLGARDMSTLDTPPPNRTPVNTTICGYDERIIREAIDHEIDRGGQVFFLHNRVASIENMQSKLQKLCPKARILHGHGQMEAEVLEGVMQKFINAEADVLVCTTIIESGVDIPNANTIIIDRADRFGLADLYQLRGRVGRGGERAHAYLMIPRDLMTGGDARKRVNAIKQYTALGSGFKIAMRDLEIRGAGNLLGTEQSGHIAAVGFDLYCQMLKATTAKLQGRRVPQPMEVSLHIDFLCLSEAQWLQDNHAAPTKRATAATAHRPPDRQKLVKNTDHRIPAFLPASYIEDTRQRIIAYRMLGETMTRKELDTLERDWRDQFGPPPPAVEHLLLCAALRLAAASANLSAVEIQETKLMLTRNGRYVLLNGKFPRLTAHSPPLLLREALQLLRTI
ncbi:transcription-repair coupling factor [Phragmitibacter flavus]|uniref:Transcription-repair-coupling factor n=1 Tax=Phragmitibacter flavus TaxID=2576071 RepID=A0A5R8K8Z5_9BACT|nr:transcription-repair coupling factor [Phragmitibacter flavus]TLD68802.1 transcription-repair coupling factor [Phragmitibacter flavus]